MRTKLLVSFLTLAVLAAAVGAVGIISIQILNDRDTEMYEEYLLTVSNMGDMRESYQLIRNNLRRLAISCEEEDSSDYDEAVKNCDTYIAKMREDIEIYTKTMGTDEEEANFLNMKKTFEGPFMEVIQKVKSVAASSRSTTETYKTIQSAAGVAGTLEGYLQACNQDNVKWAADLDKSNSRTADTVSLLQIAVMAVAVFAALFFALYLSSMITKPLIFMHNIINQAGSTGDLGYSEDIKDSGRTMGMAKDEVGQCIMAMCVFFDKIIYYGHALEAVANRDLTVKVDKIGDDDTIGNALEKMIGEMNCMFGEIRQASEQVTAGASQIADGAQSLAQGTTEQAATVQQLSSSINEVSVKTEENATKAGHAAGLSASIRESAQRGAEQMSHMLDAVKEINDASAEISKVIKSIDDIAFQTNILALNAAVEAARAGQHGKGFAVVADEVRNLAAKSAEAAKDTGSLIENSIAKASLGAKIADETSESLTEIVEGVNESAEIIQQIAEASEEQSAAIKQITVGVDQIAQVVQNNSATAEESAAASEEMSGQSALLNELVSRFRINSSNRALPGGVGYALPGGMGSSPRY
jgi:methyl-accepting chemotaxis protein